MTLTFDLGVKEFLYRLGHRSDNLENRSVVFELLGNKAQLVVNEVLIYLENSLSEHLWTDCVHLWVESKVDES